MYTYCIYTHIYIYYLYIYTTGYILRHIYSFSDLFIYYLVNVVNDTRHFNPQAPSMKNKMYEDMRL